jgi:hypothetical protein
VAEPRLALAQRLLGLRRSVTSWPILRKPAQCAVRVAERARGPLDERPAPVLADVPTDVRGDPPPSLPCRSPTGPGHSAGPRA